MVDSAEQGRSKLFVLDTNVILHDAGCLVNFEDNDIAVPITVLEELDRFKKGNDDIHFQAREFLRRLDDLTGDLLAPEGAPLGPDLGSIRVLLPGPTHERIRESFLTDSPDHRILNAALSLLRDDPERSVILVTKDTNLRMKAKALGLPAQDYSSDKVENPQRLYTGKRQIFNLASENVDQFYIADGGRVPLLAVPEIDRPIANENYILRNGSKSVLATYHAGDQTLRRIEKSPAYGIMPRNAEQSFALRALMDDEISLVTLSGTAGSGKTLLALAAALETRSRYRQILMARPIVPLSNKDLGYLPGDVSAKIDPYMQPLFDNLSVIRHQVGDKSAAGQAVQEMLDDRILEITPLAYIRGRSLQQVYFIVDESQNLTPHEVKTIITRAGEGTKIVLTGDVHQIDHPYLDSRSNGLSYLISRMKGQPLYAHITLEKGERSQLAELASSLL